MSIVNKIQLITYPDSLGGDLKTLQMVLNTHFENLFSGGVHILPPFPSSGDRGFAPLTYLDIEPEFGSWEDIQHIAKKHDVLVDLMVNHISKSSEFFQDFLKNGEQSIYADLFIPLRKVWADGIPVKADIDQIFLRRERPYSEYEMATSEKINLWTTFGKQEPSEQIDLDINAPITRELIRKFMKNFSDHGVKIVRLDAVGYVNKKMGTSCFFVEPDIYEFLDWIIALAKTYDLELLPEVHAHYSIQYKLAKRGYWIYDFILPYMVLEALITKDCTRLVEYIGDENRPTNQFTTLDCHDGIPVMPDLNDLMNVDTVRKVVDICISRGSDLSRVHSEAHKLEGGFDVHQIRGTYYSVLGEDDDAYIIARAIQFFTPGIPQVYYVGMLAGTNDHDRVKASGDGREMNRHNYTLDEIELAMKQDVVKRLVRLIEFRNTFSAFEGEFCVKKSNSSEMILTWSSEDNQCELHVDLKGNQAVIDYYEGSWEKMIL